MMKIVTGDQMRTLDQKAINGLGIPGVILMENAGSGVVKHMMEFFDCLASKKIGICCGGGNNGGDGFVAARHLMNRGLRPEVFLFVDPKKVCGDAKNNLDILFNMGGRVYEITGQEDLGVYSDLLSRCDIIVDAIFGTGLRPPVKGFLADVIVFINGLQKPVVAVDIPSGLGSDSPNILGPCIKAALTITFALPKVSHLLPPAMANVGELKVVDIGMPPFLVDEAEYEITYLDDSFLSPFVKMRMPDTHKGDYGHCLIIAGSEGKTGAAYLAAQAALRIGAGLVTLAIPESLNDIMEMKLTEAMTLPLPETQGRAVSVNAWPEIANILPRISSVAVGPGLSQDQDTAALVLKLINDVELPMVIDADALNLISGRLDLIKRAGHSPILTPHPGEMSRLIGSSVPEVLEGRPGIVRRYAIEGNCYLLLKGCRTLMANPDGDMFLNPTGNPGMASGGMGDVLTGMIAGLLSQGYPKQDAMLLGVYLHGLSGDLASQLKGEEGLIASDLFDTLPQAILKLKDFRLET
ncbi:NAD(P)H-hydrate dehydratase [bacterium]|nr:NAD(P)H-hydrate dehydratase [bacterium]